MAHRSSTRQRETTLEVPGLLVDPSWVMEQLGRPGLRLVDLREADAYASGHIPGAAQLDLSDLGSRVGGLDNVLLPPDAFSALMARCGVSSGDVVVAYDDQWGLAAARLVWALHRYGYESVALLDGGWDRWQAEGRPAAEGEEPIAPGRFEAAAAGGAGEEAYAERAWITQRIASVDVVLLDTRTPAEFDRGHLPGAICWDWFNAVPDGSWSFSRAPEELRAEWRALGVEPSRDVTVYCRSGMRAAHTYVALRNAGFARVRLYDGSWQEWSMETEDAEPPGRGGRGPSRGLRGDSRGRGRGPGEVAGRGGP
jgi:thiosulfate/3-mercaptopyruvate sulfurtransferase